MAAAVGGGERVVGGQASVAVRARQVHGAGVVRHGVIGGVQSHYQDRRGRARQGFAKCIYGKVSDGAGGVHGRRSQLRKDLVAGARGNRTGRGSRRGDGLPARRGKGDVEHMTAVVGGRERVIGGQGRLAVAARKV